MKVSLPLVEKYKPRSRSDLLGNDDVINALFAFLKNWQYKKSKPAILLVGPPGCGKTSSTHAIANDLNYIVTEVNASDTRSKASINEHLRITSEFQRLDFEDKRQLILMDEVDGLSGRYDRGGLSEFIKILKQTRYPIVCTANDPESDKIQSLISKTKIRKLEFYRLEEFEVVELLEKIASSENLEIDEESLERIAENSAGDLRAALNELESLSYGKNTKNLEKRDKARQLTDMFNELYRAGNFYQASQVWSNAPSTYLPILLHLFDHTSKQCRSTDEIYKTYSQIANADLVLARIMRTQNWSLLKYFFSFIGPGIALSKDPKYYNRINQLNNLPNQFRIRGIAKNRNKKALELAPKITPMLHISERKFVYDEFDLFVKIISGTNGADIAAWLDLEDKEIESLQKIIPHSSIFENIEEARARVGEIRRHQGLNVKVDPLFESFEINDSYEEYEINDIQESDDESEMKTSDNNDPQKVQKSLDDFF